MPSSPTYKRNYKQENKYKSKPEQIKKRTQRNAARAKLIKAGVHLIILKVIYELFLLKLIAHLKDQVKNMVTVKGNKHGY